MRVEKVKHSLLGDGRRHGDAGLVQVRKGRTKSPGPGDDAGDAETGVIRAFVAQHLGWKAGSYGTFNGGRTIAIDETLRERG
jgi:hypothetical protein